MENNMHKNGFFSTMYRTRVILKRGDVIILNLSALFSIISLLCAPWLVIIGGIVALVMGYKFSLDRDALGFEQNFDDVVKGAAQNVKNVVDNVTEHHDTQE